MNILSLNIRGVGESVKADWVKGIKTSNGIHFIAIQETKKSGFKKFEISRFWGRSMFEFDYVDAVGRSGGMLSIWDSSYFHKTGSYKHRRYLVTTGVIGPLGCIINFINIYAPNDMMERRELWVELLELRGRLRGLAVFLGDFNEVRNPEERRNSEFIRANAEAFNAFIERAGLVEYQMGGGAFTYVSDRGDKFSKLDRMLVCNEFHDKWPLAALTLLAKEHSDHRPLLLSSVTSDFGHIPFRFYNSWLDLPGFEEFVASKSGVFNFNGSSDLAVHTKLRWLKGHIKKWLAFNKQNKERVYMEKKKMIQQFDEVGAQRMLSEDEMGIKAECLSFMKEYEKNKYQDLKQKSRIKWALDGDENTKFFHGILNANTSNNRLHGLILDEEWVSNPVLLKKWCSSFLKGDFRNR